MKSLILVATISLTTVVLAETVNQDCNANVINFCGTNKDFANTCNSKYSGAGHKNQLTVKLNDYISQNIKTSFQYLLMSANFGNSIKNRDGFSKLFRKLSDSTWNDAIDLVKYITKRGGSVALNAAYNDPLGALAFPLDELPALARAVDMHKHLALKSHEIHLDASALDQKIHDAEVASYLEEEFTHKHAKVIRDLAGYVTDVIGLSQVSEPGLSIFMFDEYLQKAI